MKVKSGGGITFNATCKLTHLSEKMVWSILHDYRIFNAGRPSASLSSHCFTMNHSEILIRGDYTVDEFIDVVLGNRKYIKVKVMGIERIMTCLPMHPVSV